jgi:hypothetical protein
LDAAERPLRIECGRGIADAGTSDIAAKPAAAGTHADVSGRALPKGWHRSPFHPTVS